MKKFWKDFKAFITKGNVVDLAVAVVIGAAFGKIVTSLVNDIIMPLISLAVGGASVADWKWTIKPAQYDATGVLVKAETALKYGTFLQTIIDFLIIAFFIFLAIKIVTASQRKLTELGTGLQKKMKKNKKKGAVEELVVEETVTPAPETTDDILKDIRALLQNSQPESKDTNTQVEEKE